MITMTEIARLTQVSQPTVSRVLNGSQTVAPEVRERVLACARENDYQLNALAKGLQGSRTNLLGVLVTDISNDFFAELTKHIEIEARNNACSIILFSSGYDPDKEQEYLSVVRRYRVDGVIAVPARETSGQWQHYAKKLDMPVVAVTRRAENLDSVYVDHRSAGVAVAGHLVERGFERFLFIGKEYDGKYVGLRRALGGLGLDKRAENLVYHDYAQLLGALDAWLAGAGGRPAVFAGNDIYALRVLAALRELGVHVPEQAGVIGFDDTSVCRYLSPRLSSVSQPIEDMARRAVSRLIFRIEHPEEQSILNLPLQASLAAREST